MTIKFEQDYINLYDYNNIVIGYILLDAQSNNVFRILRVFVDPNHRGLGLANKLMDQCVVIANENNFKYIPVCTFAISYFKNHIEYNNIIFDDKIN